MGDLRFIEVAAIAVLGSDVGDGIAAAMLVGVAFAEGTSGGSANLHIWTSRLLAVRSVAR